MTAYKHLVKHAITKGFAVSVYDDEGWQVKKSTSQKAIFDAIESGEQAQLIFRDLSIENTEENKNANKMGWALITPYGVGGDETVADHNCYDSSIPNSIKFQWLDNWSAEYDKTVK